jgi:TPR repeat protein
LVKKKKSITIKKKQFTQCFVSIEPNTVKMTDIYPEHYYNQQSSNYDLSNYYQQNNKSDDLQLPPLTIDSSSSGTRTSAVYPSPVSIPSPITPGMTNEKLVQRIKVDETEALVHEGISFHEKGQLEKATQLFRIGAEKGNPIGMFLYGVSLRHGWVRYTNTVIVYKIK